MKDDRINISNVLRYFDIAEGARKNARDFAEALSNMIGTKDNIGEFVEIGSTIHNEATIAIVFSAMSLETLINEQAIKKYSNSFFKNHIDQIKLISKFVLLSKLNNTVGLDPDKQEYQELKWLINLRNELVHFKYKSRTIVDFEVKISDPLKQSDFINEKQAEKAISTVRNVIKIIDPKLYTFIEESNYESIYMDKNKKKKKY